MIFAGKEELANYLKATVTLDNERVQLTNEDSFRNDKLDTLVKNAVINPSKEIRGLARHIIKSVARDLGIFSSSIQGLYEARGRGECKGFTVPAINIRGMSYELSRAVFSAANKIQAGAYIFEIAQSEIGYTFQKPHELTAVILAAAIREKHRGPVFIQGDHFQVNAKKYADNRDKEISGLKNLIRDAIQAGFYNIDIDTSTLVDLSKTGVVEQQRANFEVGVELTQCVREHEPEGITISVGGEIGEVGKENSNEEELRAYLDHFNENLARINPKTKGISKISIQTGTSHGGVPLPDGSVADVQLDFNTLENLSRISRESYGLAGAVQHGASTLPADLFHKFPELETAEIHLATQFQNMIYESIHFPKDFKEEIYQHLRTQFAAEKSDKMTDAQFIYKTRKKGFGEFKNRFWEMAEGKKTQIGKELEDQVGFLFDKMNVKNTRELVKKTVNIVSVQPDLKSEIHCA